MRNIKAEEKTEQIAVICLTMISAVALVRGVDGMLIGSICAIIGGIAGYTFRKRRS
jgi:hypothetical protein